MIFKYSGFDKGGKKVSARIEALDLSEAKRKLKSRGVIYNKIKETNKPFLSGLKIFKKKPIASKKLSSLSRNLAIYLRSGIPIVNVVRLAKSQYEDENKIYDFLSSVETSLDEGKSFYKAIELQEIIELPTFFKQSIKVSEESGTLGEVLFELSRFIEEQDKVGGRVKQALIYPLFIIVISLFMVGFMLTVVVPKITQMFSQLKQELPGITKFVIAAGNFIGAYWLVMSIVVILASMLFTYMLKTSKKFKYIVDSLLLKTPIFGKVVQTFELARFSYIASVLVKSGVTFVHAVKLASNILENSVMQQQFQKASNEVVEGKKFSNALLKQGANVDKSFIQSVALGEETSEVALVMENLATLYFEENKDRINIFLSLLEPALILFVGVTIGFIVTAMLLPIFSMNLSGM